MTKPRKDRCQNVFRLSPVCSENASRSSWVSKGLILAEDRGLNPAMNFLWSNFSGKFRTI